MTTAIRRRTASVLFALAASASTIAAPRPALADVLVLEETPVTTVTADVPDFVLRMTEIVCSTGPTPGADGPICVAPEVR